MAATGSRKSSSGKKKSTRAKSNTSRKGTRGKSKTPEVSFEREVILWIVVAISLLLFISNFGFGGKIGNAFSRFFFGIFGLIAYIFPIVLLVGTFFAVSNKGNRLATVKIIATVLFVSFLCMFIELVLNGSDVVSAIGAYRYSFENKNGGGLIGGFLAKILCPNFGLIGSYVIDVIVLIISLVLITEKSALLGMKRGGQKVYQSAKESNERHREIQELRREERKRRRMDQKVAGVAADTRIFSKEELLSKEALPSDELNEINPEMMEDLPEIKEESHVTLTSVNDSDEHEPSYGGQSFYQEPEFSMEPRVTMEPEVTMEPTMEPTGFEAATAYEEEPPYEETAAFETAPSYDTAPLHEEEPVQEDAPVFENNLDKEPKAEYDEDSLYGEDIPLDDTACAPAPEPKQEYVYPPVSLLTKGNQTMSLDSKRHLQETAAKLQTTLKNFGVNVTITNVSCGPAVTRYELQPEMGVKVSKIVNLADDIKLNLAAADIRIEAPIPGKAAVGIEVPNKENVTVMFRDLVESEEFEKHPSKLAFCVGKDIGGKVTVADIAKMPHLLIAGATGSGKSVCINTIIMSILYKADPKEVKLIMIDPKVVELSVYNGIPHLMIPVVTDPKKAAGALHWAVAEMTERYQKFADYNVRDLKGYNAKVDAIKDIDDPNKSEKMPQIVIIVDELADLMMVAPGDVEEAICRLAQLARAAGIHLIIATQRPSVNVITGLIKANMPSRIAFAVTSGIDSRTILDMNGAEKLLGKGDMLFNPQGVPKPLRVQGALVTDKEVSDVVEFLKEHNGHAAYNPSIEEKMKSVENTTTSIGGDSGADDGRDAYFADAAKLLIEKEKGSIGMLQRYFKVGFNRAARIMDQLEEAGIVGPEEGTKPRKVLMSPEQFQEFVDEYL